MQNQVRNRGSKIHKAELRYLKRLHILMLLLLLLCLTHCFEPVLIERFGRSKNKLEAAPPPEFECVDEIDEDDTPPKEYSLKIGSLYHLADGSWYLRSEDPTTK